MSASDEVSPGVVRVMQIITFALVMGVLITLSVFVYLVQVQNQGRGQLQAVQFPLVSLIAGVLLVVNTGLSLFLPNVLIQSGLRRIAAGTWQPTPGSPAPATDAGKLLQVRQTAHIVGLALLEAANFLGCIAYFLEAQPWVLGVITVGVLLMVARFPTEGRLRLWLEDQKDALARLRST